MEKHLTREEKEKVIMKVWKSKIKDNPNTLASWAKHPKSFIRWSLKKVKKKNYDVVIRNEEYPDIWLPYNIQWIEKKRKPRNDKRQ